MNFNLIVLILFVEILLLLITQLLIKYLNKSSTRQKPMPKNIIKNLKF